MPAREILLGILSIAFWASIETEEGRTLSFALLIRCGELILANNISQYKFAEPRLFSPQELRRLAPALEPAETVIIVGTEPDLQIEGLIGIGSSLSAATSGFSSRLPDFPEAIIVRVSGPGILNIYIGRRRFASFSKGDIRFYPQATGFNVFEALIPVQQWWMEFQQGAGLTEDCMRMSRKLQSIYLNAFVAILNRIDSRRHGGAVIVNTSTSYEVVMKLKARYQFGRNCGDLRNRALDAMRNLCGYYPPKVGDPPSVDYADFERCFIRIAEEAQLIGDLAGTDGAVVIASDLSLISAGTQLPIENIDLEIDQVEYPYLAKYMVGEREPEFVRSMRVDQVGMRHRSALSFILQNPDCVAFVVSQDGGVTVICRPPLPNGNLLGRVVVVKDVRFWGTHLVNA